MNKKYILTIATGKKLYVDMAVNLARSFFWWHPNTDIVFRIVTDDKTHWPEDVATRVEMSFIEPGELGAGFSTKLHLDNLAYDGQTIFIDSDCLIYGNLDFVFEKFKGHSVSVIGNYISQGEWFGNIGSICKQFNVRQIPKFNGGIYYLEKGEIADKVYETARSLEKRYDEIGFVRLRGRPNDEVLMALAMELNHQKPIDDDGSILAEFVNFQSGIKSDLVKGVAELYNDPTHVMYQKNWHLTIARPVVVHFLGYHNQVMPYIKEAIHLKYLYKNRWPDKSARLFAYLQATLPFSIVSYLKKIFRSQYRAMFGSRKVKISERIIAND